MNGIRKRFDRSGKLTEEILFKDGNAITKTNYDLEDSLTWVRRPLDSNLVWTEVYTFGGSLIASGHEKVYNPGNLLWFQNIELTALNSVAITARSASLNNEILQDGQQLFSPFGRRNLYNTPPLVEYKKEGEWNYYSEFDISETPYKSVLSMDKNLKLHFPHFGELLFQSIPMFDDLKMTSYYDSIRVEYSDNKLQTFFGYGDKNYTHLQIAYYPENEVAFYIQRRSYGYHHPYSMQDGLPKIKELGQYNDLKERIGVWKYFDNHGKLYKTINYIIPRKEKEDEIVLN